MEAVAWKKEGQTLNTQIDTFMATTGWPAGSSASVPGTPYSVNTFKSTRGHEMRWQWVSVFGNVGPRHVTECPWNGALRRAPP